MSLMNFGNGLGMLGQQSLDHAAEQRRMMEMYAGYVRGMANAAAPFPLKEEPNNLLLLLETEE